MYQEGYYSFYLDSRIHNQPGSCNSKIIGAGQRLGGRGSPEVWTRSWGYGPFTGTERRAVYPSTEQSYGDYMSQDDADYDEAIRRSRQSYAQVDCDHDHDHDHDHDYDHAQIDALAIP